MKRSLFFLTLFAIGINCNAQVTKKWKLIWSDEFNYTGLPDSSKWNYDVGGHGWGNSELQYYTDKQTKNAMVEGGNLVITAVKEKINANNYSSARLITKGKADWLYGRIEVRAKLPRGKGTWPAIWMLRSSPKLVWPDDGEIDIMEHVGYHPGYIHFSAHTKKYYHSIGTQKTDTAFIPDVQDVFHVYGINWSREKIEWFVDDKKVFEFVNEHTGNDAWPFDRPFHLLLNVAVGGFWGGAEGVDDSIFPQAMLVDYVRVYQLKK